MAVCAQIVDAPRGLARAIGEAGAAERLAVDVEGNGLYAYRAHLCTVQLAWTVGPDTRVEIIDALALPVAPLASLLGPSGPPKLLHDCTFDARMLHEAGVALGRVTDTSVMARLLGKRATGLAALLASELGITVSKRLQHYDWSRRPLRPEHLSYLASDVAHLGRLVDVLSAEVARADIAEEVADECAYKLRAALSPPRDPKAAILRVKGGESLDAPRRVLLRHLVEARELVAERSDRPPFRIASNEALLAIARTCPDPGDPSAILSAARSLPAELALAVSNRRTDGPEPDEPHDTSARPDRAMLAEQRGRHRRIAAWRRAEADARGVDEQIVLPGHCLSDLVKLEEASVEAIAKVDGLGRARFARYASVMAALLAGDDEP
jgi:ribonuclease D